MSSTATPVYFETSWAIMSSVSGMNILFGLLVIGITNFSAVAAVPIIVSLCSAIANGLCYYAFYADYPLQGTLAAAAVADVFWMFEEAGLSFYSYFILIRVLRNRERIVFLCGFWFLMAAIFIIRIFILVGRQQNLRTGDNDQDLIRHLHIGYFTSIALVEIMSSYFLLKKFRKTQKSSADLPPGLSVFRYLMRSTEIRVATLAIIGISRAVTYSFQTTAQSATSPSGQVDRFIATAEVMFPMLMQIDLLASKLHAVKSSSSEQDSSSFTRSPTNATTGGLKTGIPRDMYSMSEIDRMGRDSVSVSDDQIIVDDRARHDIEDRAARKSTEAATYESAKRAGYPSVVHHEGG